MKTSQSVHRTHPVALALALLVLLAACGGGSAPTAAPPTTAASGQTTTDSGTGEMEKELYLYNWPDYVAPESIKAFEDKYGVKVTIDSFPSNEDLLAKVEAGGTGYDIVVPTDYMVDILRAKDALLALDKSKLPDFGNLEKQFSDAPYDPGTTYCIPKSWGTTGVMWRTDLVAAEDAPKTWADFWNLAQKYSGKVAIVDSAPDVIGAAMKKNGKPLNSTDPADLDLALKDLLALKQNIKAFESGYMPLLASGEFIAVLGWSGDAQKVKQEGAAVDYIIPGEGSAFWVDNWCILKTAPHPNAAHAFINFMLDPRIAAGETNYHTTAVPVVGALEFIKPEIKDNSAVYPSADTQSKLEPFQNPEDEDALRRREEMWTKLKGG